MLRARYDPARQRSRSAHTCPNPTPTAPSQADAPAARPHAGAHTHARGQTPFRAYVSRGAVARENLRLEAKR